MNRTTHQDESDFSPLHEAVSRFRREPMAETGILFLFFLFLCALAAPLIANAAPLFMIVPDGTISSPALRAFFAPDVQEVFVEKLFNFLLLALPLFFLMRFCLKKAPRTLRNLVLILLPGILAIPFFTVQRRADPTDWQLFREKNPASTLIFAPVPHSPSATSGAICEKPSRTHWFGTDKLGRDVFARMLYGSRVSLSVGFLASAISLAIGTAVGLFSGYRGGRVDLFIQRLVEIVICFPTFLLLLILMAILLDSGSRQSILLVILVLGCTSWPGLSRLVRGEVLKQRQMPYIQACESLGVPARIILFRHLLPNVAGPVFVSFAFDVAGAILAENSLSFLGFGVQIPTASWGELLRQALEDPLGNWNLMLWPGLAVFLCVCSLSFVADGLRRAVDWKN